MHLVRRSAFGVQLTEPQDGSGVSGGCGGDGSPGPKALAAVNWGLKQLRNDLHGPRLQRAIGVIYRPDTELYSHYFQACVGPRWCKAVWQKVHARPLPALFAWEWKQQHFLA
jgi:hypothetical protein